MASELDHKPCVLATLLADAASSVRDPLPAQLINLRRLDELRQRLVTDRFQLAVLGQFKRGKSTLLNALLGFPILPTAVVPLTAIPTFVQAGRRPCVRSVFLSEKEEEFEAGRPEELADRVAALVTEDANPNNVLGLSRVEIRLPVRLLERGVVLIDTPGVGSTFRHNTERAEAVLPECDAALFVVSPDPPITEVEIDYLAQVQATVSRLIIVLNKIDAVESDDLAPATAFLRRMLAERAGLAGNVPVFPLSARAALRAKMSGDLAALAASGLPPLEAYLSDLLAREKRTALAEAIARKAAVISGNLLTDTEIRLQALRMPIEDIDNGLRTFDTAMARLNDERRMVQDLLEGDRRRALEQIEAEAEALRLRARKALEAELDRALTQGEDIVAARASVTAMVSTYFEAELGRTFAEFRKRLSAAVDGHRRRIDELVDVVRETAARIMNATFSTSDNIEAIEFRREPYWVTSGKIETLIPGAPGALDGLLPSSIRKKRSRRRLLGEVETIVQRNVENLRWATRQNVEDAFRNLGGTLDDALAESIDATRSLILVTRDRRHNQSDRIQAESEAVQASAEKLLDIGAGLRRIAASTSALTPTA
jgi:dynamin family protein